jgi:hypothetical protein
MSLWVYPKNAWLVQQLETDQWARGVAQGQSTCLAF